MSAYQGSDWFKSGAHVKVSSVESKKQLVYQASQQIADSSRKLQAAYDEGLALFKNNFSGTDDQIHEAQQTLTAILSVSQNLQELHKRLASSMMASTSDSAVGYVADGATHSSQVLSLLKTKEQQLQHEVNKCAELRAENVLLQKRLQALSAPTTRQNSNGLSLSDLQDGSIPAGPPMSSMSSSALEQVPSHSSSPTSPFVLNGVLSLANAGTWLQMLRQKLINANAERGRPDLVDPDATDETASERAAVVTCDDFPVPAPMRRSRSDGLFDRQSSCRRGAEMLRPSRAGARGDSPDDDSFAAVRDRDRRRRTNVLMEDVQDADQGSTLHFLTPELAARSALFKS